MATARVGDRGATPAVGEGTESLGASAGPTAADGPPPPERRVIHRRHLGLRARVTTSFALGALALSGTLASITYFVVRSSIVNQQITALRRQALANGVLLRTELRVPNADIPQLLTTLDTGPNTGSLVYKGGAWYPSAPTLSPDGLPTSLRTLVLDGTAASQTVGSPGGARLVVGVPITAEQAAYFEVFAIDDLSRTLHVLLVSLALAALVTTLFGAIVGRWAASRALRPLHETAQAALAIAGGRLDTRLESEDFADLAVLSSAFNRMVDQLQDRIEREARFTSDVNHELRSPLTTLATSLSVLEARREEMPTRARQALDLLGAEVRRFRRLVDDLLEISRVDSAPGDLALDETDVGELVRHTVLATGYDVPIAIEPDAEHLRVVVDKRRFERILANLFENADRYAGGATSCSVERRGPWLRFVVEDAGPGVAPGERDRIFERFSRGSTGRRRGLGDGTGLGLAIVAQHVRQHGGRVWVEGRVGGGSRFVVELRARARGGRVTRRRAGLALVAASLVLVLAGCGLPIDRAPHLIAKSEIPQALERAEPGARADDHAAAVERCPGGDLPDRALGGAPGQSATAQARHAAGLPRRPRGRADLGGDQGGHRERPPGGRQPDGPRRREGHRLDRARLVLQLDRRDAVDRCLRPDRLHGDVPAGDQGGRFEYQGTQLQPENANGALVKGPVTPADYARLLEK